MISNICLCALLLFQVISVTGNGDSYTAEELQKLPELRAAMQDDLTQDYMFENKYLVRFLRARRLDLGAAEVMLRKSLKWRQEKNMDNILSEDFSWWEKRFPFYFPIDREGRPAAASGLRQIDFRKYVLSGKASDVLRYMFYALERGLLTLSQVSNETGTEFISGNLIFNLASYNARSHACLSCLPYWIELAKTYENYYPLFAKTIIGINVPKVFHNVADLVSPYAPITVDSIRVFSYNKQEWKRELLKLFPAENLTPEFGGTLKLSKYLD